MSSLKLKIGYKTGYKTYKTKEHSVRKNFRNSQ